MGIQTTEAKGIFSYEMQNKGKNMIKKRKTKTRTKSQKKNCIIIQTNYYPNFEDVLQ